MPLNLRHCFPIPVIVHKNLRKIDQRAQEDDFQSVVTMLGHDIHVYVIHRI